MFSQHGSSLDTQATEKIRRRARGVVGDALRRLGRLGRLDPTDLGGDVSKQIYRETTETRRVCVVELTLGHGGDVDRAYSVWWGLVRESCLGLLRMDEPEQRERPAADARWQRRVFGRSKITT